MYRDGGDAGRSSDTVQVALPYHAGQMLKLINYGSNVLSLKLYTNVLRFVLTGDGSPTFPHCCPINTLIIEMTRVSEANVF